MKDFNLKAESRLNALECLCGNLAEHDLNGTALARPSSMLNSLSAEHSFTAQLSTFVAIGQISTRECH